jgi:hypothetical protein
MTGDEMAAGPECSRYADELAELALGIATGRERAEALAHVERCSKCHSEMEQLSAAADSMLEVIPGIEPPLGFEVRLAERLGAGRAGRPAAGQRWRVRRLSLALASLAALIALGAGLGAGWLVRGSGPPPAGRSAFGTEQGGRVTTRSLVSGGRAIGYVTVYSDPASGGSRATSWLYMSLDAGSWSGTATCEVRLADGSHVQLGSFWLDHGYGAWGVAVPAGTRPISSAYVSSGKEVLASADFAPAAAAFAPRATEYPGVGL